jgi:hypothetical protein
VSRTVEYTGDKWRGTVTLRDPLYLPDVLAIEEAQEQVSAMRAAANGEMGLKTVTLVHRAWLEPICEIVEEWHLEGFPENVTPKTFPASPRIESAKLVAFLIGEMLKIYEGDAEQVVPNG